MPPIPRRLGARALAGASAVLTAGLLALSPTPADALRTDVGRVYAFGGARDLGFPNDPLVGLAAIPTGTGYWTVTSAGAVRNHGDAPALGSARRPGVVDIAGAHAGRGYSLVHGDGTVETFGDAAHHGDMAGKALNSPIVGIAVTPTGDGYWLAAADGGIFSFGDARFLGSMGGSPLVAPITGIAATPTGKGYWLAAADGGVFSFGDAEFRGSVSTGGITAIAGSPTGIGYWLVGGDGDVHAFGAAPELGDLSTTAEVVDLAPRPQRDGYWLATGDERAGTAGTYRAAAGDPPDSDFDRLAQCESSGNWGARGNGYEGGLQFLNSTWHGYGGGEFAQHAYDASREQQIEIARRVWRDRGWSPWPHCSRAVGLR